MIPNLITLTEPNSPAAEAYRNLRVNLMSAGREKPLRTLLVAAASADPDKAATGPTWQSPSPGSGNASSWWTATSTRRSSTRSSG